MFIQVPGLAFTQVKKTSHLVASLRDHSRPFAAARGAFTCIRAIPLSCTGPEKPRGVVVMYMYYCATSVHLSDQFYY